MSDAKIDLLGAGSALLDILVRVDDAFLADVAGEKGGMNLLDAEGMESLCAQLPEGAERVPGGSAANTIQGAAHLGLRTGLLGKTGADESGRIYLDAMAANGVSTRLMKTDPENPTGRCCSLVTPDSERTMRTFLGAAAAVTPDEVQEADFTGVSRVHVEGYQLFNTDLFMKTVECARAAGCSVSLDLASFEVVEANRKALPGILKEFVDVVFANEDEAAAYAGTDDPEAALAQLTDVCSIAAVKLGADGAWIGSGDEKVRVGSPVVTAVDTTGAGDLWAGGFLWALARGKSLRECGEAGAVLGSEVVQVMGAQMPESTWARIRERCGA